MTLYRAKVEIEDDPAFFSATILVVAADRKEAIAIAKEAAVGDYYAEAGGWASHATKVTHVAARKAALPEHGIVMVSGHYSR